jgi:hypothetical protein
MNLLMQRKKKKGSKELDSVMVILMKGTMKTEKKMVKEG